MKVRRHLPYVCLQVLASGEEFIEIPAKRKRRTNGGEQYNLNGWFRFTQDRHFCEFPDEPRIDGIVVIGVVQRNPRDPVDEPPIDLLELHFTPPALL